MKVFAKRQYIITITFIVLVIAFFSFIYLFATNTMNERQEAYLIKESELMENEISQFFIETALSLKHIENYIEVNGTFNLLSYIISVHQEHDNVASIYYLSKDNEMINSSGFIPPASIDFRTRDWYIQAIEKNDINYSNAFINTTQDRVIITISYPVFDEDLLLGVVAADIDIRTIHEYVSNYQVGEQGFVLLIDKNSNLLCHFNYDSDKLELTPYRDFSNEQIELSGNGFLTNYEVLDTLGVIAYRNILNDSYLLVTYMPKSEYGYFTDIFFSFYVILSLIIVILGVFQIVLNQNHVFSPFKYLLKDIDKIDVINHSNYRLTTKSKGFREVREKLNLSLDATSHYLNLSQETNRNLIYENQKVKLLMSSTADIIFELDLDLKFESVFGRGLSKIGMKPEDFIGKTVLELFGEEGRERHGYYQQAILGKSANYQWCNSSNNEKLYFESSIAPIYDENQKIVGAVGISRDITENKKKQDEIDYINCHDYLTGLYNRKYYTEMLIEMDQEAYFPLGIMNLDLNGLKILNDAFGHEYGDIALKKIGLLLSKHINSNSIVARVGGDEFAAIIPNTSQDKMYAIKAKVKEAINTVMIENIQLSIAVGYEIKVDHKITMEEILRLAENQMYRNKLTEGMSVRNNSIRAIQKTINEKYDNERIHSEKVSDLCKQLGKAIGIKDENLKELEMAGMYHDIGKISIPDAILNKPGKLTKEEYDFIKTHVDSGYQILRAADEYSNLAEYAYSHHERWDGNGYPKGLIGEEIPLYSRIIGIVDAYEAMTSDRVYRKRLTDEEALLELKRNRGTQFDPNLLDIFIKKVLKKS